MKLEAKLDVVDKKQLDDFVRLGQISSFKLSVFFYHVSCIVVNAVVTTFGAHVYRFLCKCIQITYVFGVFLFFVFFTEARYHPPFGCLKYECYVCLQLNSLS